MKYILNAGRYALSFEIDKNGQKKTIVLERRRRFTDTGNIAVSGITPVADDDYAILEELPIFQKRFKDTSFALSLIDEDTALGKADKRVNDLEKENKELLKKLKNATPEKVQKQLEDKDKEINNLKAQLEALTKGKDPDDEKAGEENPETTEGQDEF